MARCRTPCTLRRLLVTLVSFHILMVVQIYRTTLYRATTTTQRAQNIAGHNYTDDDVNSYSTTSETLISSRIRTRTSWIYLPPLNFTCSLNIQDDIRELQFIMDQNATSEPSDSNITEYKSIIEIPDGVSKYYESIEQMCADEDNDRLIDRPLAQPLCPCVPEEIKNQHLTNELSQATFSTIAADIASHNATGGYWRPPFCIPRRRVAIVVPFRDRYSHLQAFLRRILPVLQGQQLEYKIYVIEQMLPYIFNKGSIMNAGFMEVVRRFPCDCVVFHDVDMLAETLGNIIFCHQTIVHIGAYVDKFRYKLIYPNIFGGAVAIQPAHFIMLNGFSNTFYGWGGEDDNFYNRVHQTGLKSFRGPDAIARYKMIRHRRDKANPVGYSEDGHWWGYREAAPIDFTLDGLSNVNYSVETIDELPLYTKIVISLIDIPRDGRPPPLYTSLPGDCYGNDIRSIGKASRASCQWACDVDNKCEGYVYMTTSDLPTCFLKSAACHKDNMTEKANTLFYVKPGS